MSRFGLDVDQSNAILEMQLRRLTGLEQDKVKAEYDELLKKIAEYESILASRQKFLTSSKLNFLKIKKNTAMTEKLKFYLNKAKLQLKI